MNVRFFNVRAFNMGIFDSLFGSGSKSNTSSGVGSLPQWAQTGFQDVYSGIKGMDSSTFAPAPFNATQQSALSQLSSRPAIGNFNFGQQANQAFGNAANTFDTANSYTAQGVNPITGQEIGTNIGYFMNPYEDQVVNTALNDLNRQYGDAYNQFKSEATAAGGFGGTRQATIEGQRMADLARASGDVSGNLRNQGYQSAASNALNKLQTERSNFLTGAGVANQTGSALSNLGTGLMNARTQVEDIRRQQGVDTLSAGNQMQGQQTAVQQQDLSKLQALLSALQALPSSSTGTERGATQGLFGLNSGGGNAAGGLAGGLKSLAGMF